VSKGIGKSAFFILLFSLFTFMTIFLLVRGAGAIAGVFLGSNGVITGALAQLARARIVVPFWIPVCGAAAVCGWRALSPKRPGGKTAVPVAAASIVILLVAFAAAFLLTRVNGVFVHVAFGIIRMLLESGVF
jgi:hypothetical protein